MTGKNILLFADGTGNSMNTMLETNVWRLYQAADLRPGSPRRRRQVAYYSDGVGASPFAPFRIIQSIFGKGLRRNVLAIYSYACRNYEPGPASAGRAGREEEGDQIYGFGFSRGAFTMRVVIDLIADQGLVPYTTERDLEWKSRAAYREFRRNSLPRYWLLLLKLLALAPAGRRVRRRFGRRGQYYDSNANYQPVIRLIGVWDTVAAYGGPIIAVTRAIDNWAYRLSLPHHRLHVNVRCARHALALDDARESFHPLLWDEVAEEELVAGADPERFPWLREGRIEQVWFPGMHADVGGGYPKDTLCHVSLLWMLEEAENSGLRTLRSVTNSYVVQANSYGMIHNSRSGYGALYRYNPRRINAWLHPVDPRTLSFRDPSTADEFGAQKGLIRQAVVHESVLHRIFNGTDGYAPISLPREFSVTPPMRLGEAPRTKVERDGDSPESQQRFPLFDEEQQRLIAADPQTQEALERSMRPVWRAVRARRLAYFASAGYVLALASAPWWAPAVTPVRLPSYLSVALGGVNVFELFESLRHLLAQPFAALNAVVPEFMRPWTGAWSTVPFQSWVLIIGIIASPRGASVLAKLIEDRARRAWLGSFKVAPSRNEAQAVETRTRLEALFDAARDRNSTMLEGILENRQFQRSIQFWKWSLAPNLIVLLVVWLLYAAGASLL